MQKLIVILGPTASGKTDLAIKLARQFNGEIVSADSRQIYSEMAIGTASPFLYQKSEIKNQNDKSKCKILTLKNIPHHLFHFVSPDKSFSVAEYQKLAIKTIKDAQKRDKLPFLVGGSAFYIYPIVEGWVFPTINKNNKLRKALENKPLAELLKMLKSLDAKRFKEIDQKNKRRVIRAIEIAKALGNVPKIEKKPMFDCLLLGLKITNQILKQKIEKRVDNMIKSGLEQEVRGLIKKYGWTDILKNTIGYAEWFGSWDKLDSVKFKIKQNSWQFAKRQMTWFKRDKNIHWLKNQKQAERLIKIFIK